tara:strand:+ start:322 stop:501 length:180 start_codon:yes stop_codon:yes gene_type:complete
MKLIKYPHVVNHKKKEVYIHIESGFPTTLGVPHLVNQNYPTYKGVLVSKEYLKELQTSN